MLSTHFLSITVKFYMKSDTVFAVILQVGTLCHGITKKRKQEDTSK